MNTELKMTENLLTELKEAEKVDIKAVDNGTYSVTVEFGGFLSIICC